MLPSLLAVALSSSLAVRVLAQEAECYAPNGSLADNLTYVPCNKLGINQDGVFSSCCALDGPPEERDTCSSSGLCINRQGQPQRGFCTDREWHSMACNRICMDEESGGSSSNTSFLTSCNDGTGQYCCGRSNTSCCGTPAAISIATQEAVCTANTTDGMSSDDASTFKNATIGLAAATGASILIGLISALLLWRQNKSLRRQLAEKTDARPSPGGHHTPSQTIVESQYPSSYAGTSPPPHVYKHPYSTSPRDSEFQHGNMHRYSELDASTATARSEIGSPTPYDQPQPYVQQGRDSPVPERGASPMHTPHYSQS